MLTEFEAGRLKVRIYKTRREMGQGAAQDAAQALRNILSTQAECNVIFAAAPSQNEFLDALCRETVDWGRVNAFHMDEYIGLPKDASQGFGNFLRRAIFGRVPFKNVFYLNGANAGISKEIERYSELLQRYPVDVVFMGIGENGHIAFNDPHVSRFDDAGLVKRVELDERCRLQQVHDGCFSSPDEVPRYALTLTVPALVSARRIFCIVPGGTKADAVRQTVLGEIRETLPASILRTHPDACLYLDEDSAQFLKQLEIA